MAVMCDAENSHNLQSLRRVVAHRSKSERHNPTRELVSWTNLSKSPARMILDWLCSLNIPSAGLPLSLLTASLDRVDRLPRTIREYVVGDEHFYVKKLVDNLTTNWVRGFVTKSVEPFSFDIHMWTRTRLCHRSYQY